MNPSNSNIPGGLSFESANKLSSAALKSISLMSMIKRQHQGNMYHVDFSSDRVNQLKQQAEIRIFTLGHFALYQGEKDLLSGRNPTEKPLELLKALIAQGSKNVGVIRLCDALWPDVDGDIAHSSFSVTLHRLRKILGKDALVLEGNRLSLNPEYCWVDAWYCEFLLKELDYQFTWNNIHTDYVQILVDDLIEIYTGDFLGSEDERTWDIVYRDKLHTKFQRVIQNVCRHYEALGQCEKAINLYLKALELDPGAENLYYKLIQCYLGKNRMTEAARAYSRCEKVVRTTLNIGLSQNMKKLHAAIFHA